MRLQVDRGLMLDAHSVGKYMPTGVAESWC